MLSPYTFANGRISEGYIDVTDESYLDEQPSYASNEVTINWNVTLFALSAGIDALGR